MPPIWPFMRHLAFLLFFSSLVHGEYKMEQEGITWDCSCSESKQKAIKVAWEGALELGHRAWKRFDTHTRPVVERGVVDEAAQRHINTQDPAYVQLFTLDWSREGVERIKNVLSNVTENVNAKPGTKKRPIQAQSEVTIACPELGSECGEEELAFTDDFQWKGQYAGSTISFCPGFFSKLASFAELKSAAKRPISANGQMDEQQRKVRALFEGANYQGTDAKQVYHEMTHLWWIGPTNGVYGPSPDTGDEDEAEEYGYMNCARIAAERDCDTFNREAVVWNADAYAWYAEYGYWAEEGFDSWQQQHRPVQIPVRPRI